MRTYESATGLFTPRSASGKRLRFNAAEVMVLSGEPDHRHGLGAKGTVKIHGIRYRVYGASCGLPNCQCDAVIRRVKNQRRAV